MAVGSSSLPAGEGKEASGEWSVNDQPEGPMIKTILVPATGNDMDIAVFRSALTVARAFAAHLEFLHVHVDATAMAATMLAGAEVQVSATVIGLVERIEKEAGLREAKAEQTFQEFCARER